MSGHPIIAVGADERLYKALECRRCDRPRTTCRKRPCRYTGVARTARATRGKGGSITKNRTRRDTARRALTGLVAGFAARLEERVARSLKTVPAEIQREGLSLASL